MVGMRNRLSEYINLYNIPLVILMFFITCTLALGLVLFSNTFIVLLATIVICSAIFYKPNIMILCLVLYLPFEQLFFQLISLPYLIYIKLLPEIILYGVLFHIIITKIIKNKPFFHTPLDLPLLLIFIWSSISIIVNKVPLEIGVLGLRQVFRYSAVFFILSQITFEIAFAKKLINAIIVMTVIESIIGILQILTGNHLFSGLFNQRTSISVGDLSIPVAGYQVITIGTRIFATMGRYDLLGYYLSLGIILCLGFYVHNNYRYQRKILLVCISIISIALVQTFSRQSIASVVFGLCILWIFTRKKALLIAFSSVIIFFIIMSAAVGIRHSYFKAEDPSGNAIERIIGGLYMPQWIKTNYARAYVLFVVAKRVLEKRPLIGLGPGAIGSGVTMSVNYEEGYKKLLTRNELARYTSDVGWVSLLAQYGTIGLSMFILILIRLFLFTWSVYHKSEDIFIKSLCASYGTYIVSIALLCFFSHPFEIRYVSFYFWLIGGIVISYGLSNRKRLHQNNKINV